MLTFRAMVEYDNYHRCLLVLILLTKIGFYSQSIGMPSSAILHLFRQCPALPPPGCRVMLVLDFEVSVDSDKFGLEKFYALLLSS